VRSSLFGKGRPNPYSVDQFAWIVFMDPVDHVVINSVKANDAIYQWQNRRHVDEKAPFILFLSVPHRTPLRQSEFRSPSPGNSAVLSSHGDAEATRTHRVQP
jgi:hypothetical protein